MDKVKVSGKMPESVKSIIVDLPQGLGDQIMCFPVLPSLRMSYPDARIVVFTVNRSSQLLLKYNNYIDDIKIVPLKFTYCGIISFFLREYIELYRYFRRERFDLFLIVHPNPFRTLLSKLLPAEAVVVNKEHVHKAVEISNVLKALGKDISYDYSVRFSPDKQYLQENGLKEKGYVLVDLYAQHLDRDPRQWPYFKELISALKARGYVVAVAGVNKSHQTIDGVVDLVNATNFDQLLTLVASAKAVVSMDTGFFHFSYMLNTPVVALFGCVNPAERIPYDKSLKVDVLYKSLPCSPCIVNKVDIPCKNINMPYECMKRITVDEVIQRIDSIIQKS